MKYRKSGAINPAQLPKSLTRSKIIRLDNHRGGRHYQVEGAENPYPSVTTILGVVNKPALIPWAKNMTLDSVREALTPRIGKRPLLSQEWVDEMLADAKRRSDEIKTAAADYGTQAHDYIEKVIQGYTVDLPPEFAIVMDNFLAWQKEFHLDISLSETMVYSAQYGYAGSMDAAATSKGKIVALDWKTSNGLYREYDLQVAAYANALHEMTGQPVTEAWVVRFGKTKAEFECRQVEDLDVCFTGFVGAMSLWKALNSGPKFTRKKK